jgi:hypothetical protein
LYSQSLDGGPNRDEIQLQKLTLISDLKSLAVEIPKIEGPLARALAATAIADAVWTLDRDWAKTLLREAYKLTYPPEDERIKSSPKPVGAQPQPPTENDRARNEVRSRILNVAGRDKTFADQLMRESSEYVSNYDQQLIYSNLARGALDRDNREAAIPLIQQTIEADPTQITFIDLVNDLAIKDRAAADRLLLQCIDNLRALQLSSQNAGRTYFSLMSLVFPNSIFPDPNKRIPNPGPAVMRSYVSYVIESLASLEQREPGSIKFNRSVLLSAWLPLKAHAPELTRAFLQLEAASRRAGQDSSLPTQSYEETDKEKYRKKASDALSNNQPDDNAINSAISRDDFETARRLVDKLQDGERKSQFMERLNIKEAISLTAKGDLLAAQSLAERLTKATSFLQVYPLIVRAYVASKDQAGATASIHRAMKQIKSADTKPFELPAGIPVSVVRSGQEFDPVLLSLSRLAKAVLPIDGLLAAEVVDELVGVANRSEIDTKQGQTGFDTDVFCELAAKDEVRARSAAEGFQDHLRRIVALAAIYQWKAKELEQSHNKTVKVGLT